MSFHQRDFIRYLALLLVALLAATGVVAQEGDTGGEESLDPTVVRMFRVEHADPNAIATALNLFGSITPNRDLGVITVRARASSITAIEEALKVLDRPQGPAQSLELTAHLLTASKNGKGMTNLPGDLESVAHQLKSAMGYTHFSLLETIVLRISDRGRANTNGFLPALTDGHDRTQFHFQADGVQIGPGNEEGRTIRIERLGFETRVVIVNKSADGESITTQPHDVGLNTTIEFLEGQHAVVGKAISDGTDRSVFLIVSARVL